MVLPRDILVSCDLELRPQRAMPTTYSTRSSHLILFTLAFIVLSIFPGLPYQLLTIPFRLLSTHEPTVPSRPVDGPSSSVPVPPPPLPSSRCPTMSSSWVQKTFTLPPQSRGSYLITNHVVSSLPEIKNYKVGLLHLFIQHTSCALSLNENWDSDVREDMSDALDRLAPEDRKGNLYRHAAEGSDDMPVRARIGSPLHR